MNYFSYNILINFFKCMLVFCMFLFIFVPISVYWPAHPDDPQGIRVASVIEFSVCLCVCLFVCLFVCLSVLGKFSNFFLHYKAAAVRAVISIRYGSKEGVQGSLLVHQYIVT